jgi:hypothetical protein
LERTKRVRKLVVVGAALAVVGATVPVAYSQSSGDQVVSATVASLISLSAGADVNLGQLDPLNGAGNNDGIGTFDVSSNVPYTVTAESSSATMEDAGQSTALVAPLQIAPSVGLPALGTSTNTTAANAAGGVLVGTNLALLGAGTGDGTDNYSVSYLQPSSFADQPGSYSVTLTYTAAEPI